MAKSDYEKKQIIADYVECGNYSEVARKYNMSVNGIKDIVLADKDTAKLCKQKKEENSKNILEAMEKLHDKKINIINLCLDEIEQLLIDHAIAPSSIGTLYGIICDKELKIRELQLKEKEISKPVDVQKVEIVNTLPRDDEDEG